MAEFSGGRAQVFRIEKGGRDVIARVDEQLDGRLLLQLVMSGGQRTDRGRTDLEGARRRTREELERFADPVRALSPAKSAYPVCVSDRLGAYHAEIIRTIEARNA